MVFTCVCVTFAASLLKCPVAPVVWKASVIFSPQNNHGMQMEPELVVSKASCKVPFANATDNDESERTAAPSPSPSACLTKLGASVASVKLTVK